MYIPRPTAQIRATVAAALAILVVLTCMKWKAVGKQEKNLYLSIDWPLNDETCPDNVLENLADIINKHAKSCDLRRYDSRPENVDVLFNVEVNNAIQLDEMIQELRNAFPGVGTSFIDQSQLPSV